MKKIIMITLALALLTFTACGGSDAPDALVPFASNEYQGEYLDAVVAELEGAGFTNISTEALFTLSDNKDGTVSTVTIDGNHLFRKLDKYAPDVPVVVSYYDLEEPEAEELPTVSDRQEPPLPQSIPPKLHPFSSLQQTSSLSTTTVLRWSGMILIAPLSLRFIPPICPLTKRIGFVNP